METKSLSEKKMPTCPLKVAKVHSMVRNWWEEAALCTIPFFSKSLPVTYHLGTNWSPCQGAETLAVFYSSRNPMMSPVRISSTLHLRGIFFFFGGLKIERFFVQAAQEEGSLPAQVRDGNPASWPMTAGVCSSLLSVR